MCPHCWNGWGSNGMVTNLAFDPLVPPLALGVLGAGTLLIVGLALRRGLVGWWLRTLALTVVLAALSNPALRQEDRTPLGDIVLIVIDRSASDTIVPRPDQIETAIKGVKARLAAIDGVEVRTVEIADAPTGSNAGTLLMTALRDAQNAFPRARIAGAIVISDGQVHDMKLAPADFPAPVHLLLSGHAREWDRRLAITNAPAFAILGETVTLRLRVEDLGAVPPKAGATSDVTISVDGGPAHRFRVRVGEEVALPLTLAHGGRNMLQISIPPSAGELSARNNQAVVTMNGVRDRLRVLLVSGEPHAGERTWRNLLKSDASVDLVHFTILRPPGKQDGVPVNELSLIAFPTQELFLDKITQFDLIIFDRYRLRGILPPAYLENVARYVDNGGAVLVAAGPAFAGVESLYRSPLSRIMPARPTAGVFETGFLPRISELGHRHPVTQGLADFAPRPSGADGTPGWGRWFRMIDLKPVSGKVVMTGPGQKPLLILERVGKGRVALLASDQAWLWDRGFEGGGPQLELLRRLAHWMMKEPELEEEALRATVRANTVTVTRRTLAERSHALKVEGPGGKKQTLFMEKISPGRYQVTFQGEENGLYRLEDRDIQAVVALGPTAPKEFENPLSTGDLMAPLVKATHGGVHRLENGLPAIRLVHQGRVASGRGWIGLTPRGAHVTEGVRLVPLGPALWLLLLASAFTLLAWRREGA